MISEIEVLRRLAEALGVEPGSIRPETKATDVENWDSMGTMAIVLMLAEEFGIVLEPSETGRLQSVESVLQLLRDAGHMR